MPIDLIVESLDGMEDAAKSLYAEKDGKFYLDPDKYADVQAQGLKKKNGELLGKLSIANTNVKAFEPFKGLLEADEDERSQFLEAWSKRGESGNGKPDSNPEQAELEKKLHARELKKRDEEIGQLRPEVEKLRSEVREFRLWTPLREMFIAAGGEPKDWELARLDLANQKRFDFDEDGKIVVIEDGVSSSVSPERFFKEVYSDQRPKFYKASGAGGSGAQPGTGNGNSSKTIKREAFEGMGQAERMAKLKDGWKVVD